MLTRFLSQFDLFPASFTLRLRNQSQKMNACSGMCSLMFYLGGITLITTMIIDIFEFKVISSTNTNNIAEFSNYSISNFPFAIGLMGLNISDLSNMFTVQGFNLGEARTPLQFVPCTMNLMSGITEQDFKQMRLSTYLCVKSAEQIKLKGFITNSDSKFLVVEIVPCIGVGCLPLDQIQTTIADITKDQALIASFVPLTTGFNPTQFNSTFKYTYKDSFYLTFTSWTQIKAVHYVSSYEIKSDKSIWPFSDYTIQSGNFIQKSLPLFSLRNQGEAFFSAIVMASPSSVLYERVYGKIDEIFSYIGGLLGIIVSVLGVFMASFNEYKYELSVADTNFGMGTQDRATQKNMNFFRYIQYSFYEFIKGLFCRRPNWKTCQNIQEARDEAIGHLDVGQLLKRISNLQKMVNSSQKNNNLDILYYMSRPKTISEARHRRIIKEYIDKMSQHPQNLSIKQLQMVDLVASSNFNSNSFHYSLKSSGGSQQIILKYVNSNLERCLQILQSIQITEQDLQAVTELTEIFNSASQAHKQAIYREIPIGILYHMMINHQSGQQLKKRVLSIDYQTIKVEDIDDDSKIFNK